MRDRDPRIIVQELDDGWAAVLMGWNLEGFWEPSYTSIGRYATEADAAVEANIWADRSGISYRE